MNNRTLQITALVVFVALGALLPFLFGVFGRAPFADCPDGTYTAESEGYRKHMLTQVTFEGGYITAVEVVQHYEKNREYYEEPVRVIPERIITSQSTDVDAVSGATMTSTGIINGVNAAIDAAQSAELLENTVS